MWKTTEGSTGRLLQLCVVYFLLYVATGMLVKYFLGKPEHGFPGFNGIEFTTWNTIGGSVLVLGTIMAIGWHKRLQSAGPVHIGSLSLPGELLYILPSGIMTAIVIPTTTLLYTLPISIMVAQIIMRSSLMIVSRIVDAIQIRQGILKKKVYAEENWAVAIAFAAASLQVFWALKKPGSFDFLGNRAAMIILGSYIGSYAIRLYIMNYFKNTRPHHIPLDNRGFFAWEQIGVFLTFIIVGPFLYFGPRLGWQVTHGAAQMAQYQATFVTPHPMWLWAVVSGIAFGGAAIPSVFLFMFKGRTASFATVVNRLTSLVAGTVATLLFAFFFKGHYPKVDDWISMVFILVAMRFLALAEKRRVAELLAEHEIEAASPAAASAPAKA